MSGPGPDLNDPSHRLLRLLGGKWVTAALTAAAELGIADLLAEEPQTCEQLAARLQCDGASLLRLMRVLGGEGLFDQDVEGRYSLTEMGEQLRDGQLRQLARFVGSDFNWAPWPHLSAAVQGGPSAFERAHGQPLFEYLDDHEQDSALYHSAVDEFTKREARALAQAFDFTDVETVVDVGGGLGTLLIELTEAWPSVHGVLYDRPQVAEAASARFSELGLSRRCEAVGGDFTQGVPPGADAYVIKHVLHNWDDERCLTLLKHCVASMRPGGSVLIIEGMLLPGNRPDGTKLMDLEMMVLCGTGRERTKPEFRKLLRAAGLKAVSGHDLAGTTRLLVARPL